MSNNIIYIKEYHDKFQDIWDEFVRNSKNGTIFHSRKFLSYHSKNKWIDCSIMFFSGEKIVAVFSACNIKGEIISHQGSTSGGLIVNKNNTLNDSLQIFKLIIKYFEKFEISFRKHEYIFDTYPSEEVEFAAIHFGFKKNNVELSTCIDLKSHKEYSKSTSSKIRRSHKKLKIVFDDSNYEEYHKLLIKNLKEKHDSLPTHTVDEIIKLKELFPNNYYLVTAYFEDRLVAGVWLLKTTHNTLHTFYISLNYEFKSLYPLYSVFDFIVKYGKEKDMNYLNFGISTEDNGSIINEGLFNFKESFGGFGVTRSIYTR